MNPFFVGDQPERRNARDVCYPRIGEAAERESGRLLTAPQNWQQLGQGRCGAVR